MEKTPLDVDDLLALMERAAPLELGGVKTVEALMGRVEEFVERARRQALCLRFEALFEKACAVERIEFNLAPRQNRRELKFSHKPKFDWMSSEASGPPLTPKQVTALRAEFLDGLDRWAELEARNARWSAYFACAPSRGAKEVGQRLLGPEGYASWMARREGAEIAKAAPEPESGARRAGPRI